MKKYIFILSILSLALSACDKEGLTSYNPDTHYLYIPDAKDMNVTAVTFRHHPNVDHYDVLFDVHLAGLSLAEDKAFSVEVVADETTAAEEDYAVEKRQVFHAGVFKDKLKITLHKTAHLDEETVKVKVRLVPNETFGLAEYLGDTSHTKALTASVTFNNKLSKPLWWDEVIVNEYLGKWTATKYERFIESCDGEVLDLTDYDADEIRLIGMKFADDIEANGWLDEDGLPMSIPIY